MKDKMVCGSSKYLERQTIKLSPKQINYIVLKLLEGLDKDETAKCEICGRMFASFHFLIIHTMNHHS